MRGRRKTGGRLPSEQDVPGWLQYAAPVLLALIALAISAWALRGMPVPPQAAEGLAAGSVTAAGDVPYRDFLFPHAPGAAVLYALLVTVFGHSAAALHLFSTICAITASLVILYITRRMTGSSMAALFAAFCYPILQYALLPGAAESPQSAAACIGLLSVLLVVLKSRRWLGFRSALAGAAAAFAVLVHPSAVVALIPVLMSLGQIGSRGLAASCRTMFWAGAALPLGLVLGWLLFHGALGHMATQLFLWLPAVSAPNSLASLTQTFSAASPNLIRLLWLIPGLPLVLMGLWALSRGRHGKVSPVLAWWLAAGAAAALAGMDMEVSDWAALLPVWCITGGAGLEVLMRRFTSAFVHAAAWLWVMAAAVGAGYTLYQWDQAAPQARDRASDHQEVALTIQALGGPSTGVLMWERSPEILALTGMRSAAGTLSAGAMANSGNHEYAWRFFRQNLTQRLPDVVVVRRRQPGERLAQHALPPESAELTRLISTQYVLVGKEAGREIFVLSSQSD